MQSCYQDSERERDRERERERAYSILNTSYRLQANAAGLADRVEVQIWSASRDASEQQLSGPVCGNLREQSMKLRHRVNVETLQKE